MKKHKILIIGGVLVVTALILTIYQFVSREPTSIEIVSIHPSQPAVGERMTVNFRVFGGAGDFSIAILPDTQHYSQAYPDLYYAQTQWIVENRHSRNIIFVSHLGDLVQHDDMLVDEWEVADNAMRTLDGVIPYGVLPGNHDMQAGGTAHFYNQYFPASRFQEDPWWGGNFNENKNSYHLLTAAGTDYIFLHLQYCPPDTVIDWVNEVLQNYSDRKAIVATHSFLLDKGKRVGHCQEKSDGDNSGYDIWKKVIRKNTNIFMVLSGHIPGASRRADEVDGRVVYQLLSDYQDMSNGGDGYLRVITFQPNLDKVRVITYSPALDAYLMDDQNQFDLYFDMIGGRLPSGTVTITNGNESCQATVADGYCELVISDANGLDFRASYTGDLFFKGSVSE